jgi:membrane protease YdiL (CAAX protease family)
MLLCSSYPTQLLLAGLLLRLGLGETGDGSLSLTFVAVVSLADTAIVVGLMLWFIRSNGQTPRNLWLGARPVGPEVVTGILASPLVFLGVGLLLFAIQRLAPWLHDVPDNPLQSMAHGGLLDAAVLGLVAVVAGAVREELQRAFLIDRFEQDVGPVWIGVVLLSVAFGLGHLLQGRDAAIATGALGACWAALYVKRRSIVVALVSHAIFNSLEVFQMIAAGPRVTP